MKKKVFSPTILSRDNQSTQHKIFTNVPNVSSREMLNTRNTKKNPSKVIYNLDRYQKENKSFQNKPDSKHFTATTNITMNSKF